MKDRLYACVVPALTGLVHASADRRFCEHDVVLYTQPGEAKGSSQT